MGGALGRGGEAVRCPALSWTGGISISAPEPGRRGGDVVGGGEAEKKWHLPHAATEHFGLAVSQIFSKIVCWETHRLYTNLLERQPVIS